MKCGALFAGIGGFCIGFEQAGFETAWAVEKEPGAADTYAANLPHVRLLNKDVREVSVLGDKLEPVDVLHAGFPCQSFSQAGAREGFDDPRGQLFHEIIRIIEEFGSEKPKMLVLENAPFLRYGEGGAWFLQLQNAIRKAGYWFREENSAELNAYELTAVPQQRIRLFMVASDIDTFLSGRFAFPSATPDVQNKNLADYVDFTAEVGDEYRLAADNRYSKMITKSVTDGRRVYQLRKYEVRAKEPDVCPTLTANMGQGGHNVPFVATENGLRKLTEYECLRLQGFPPAFRFPENVPRWKRYVQVGNAVCVPVAQLIAERVADKLQKSGGGYGVDSRVRVSA